MLTPKIWVRILWSRPKLEYPKEEIVPWQFPLSELGAHMFAKEWPTIRKQLGRAIARGRPPEQPIQPPQRNAGSRPSSGDSPAFETPSSLGPRG
jgi:hypothetical protein